MKNQHTKEQKNTLTVMIITAFITTFMGSALNLSIISIEKTFDISAQTVGWVVTVYMLTCASLAVPFGKLADISSRKKILCIGILVFSLASFLCVFSWSIGILLALRFAQGFGAAMIFSTNMAILVGAFDGSERGRVLGYSTCSTYVGLSAGPVLGGLLNNWFGWESIFIVAGVISMVVFILAVTKLPKDVLQTKGEKIDALGSLLFIVSLVAIMYGISTLTKSWVATALIAFGLTMGVWFVRRQLKVENPVIKMSLFKDNKGFAYSNLASLLNYGATFAISYLLSIYLQMIMGFSSQIAGIVLITAPLVQAILSPMAGKLSDTHSPYKLSSLGMGICAVCLGIFVFINENTSLIMIIGTLVLVGVGFALFASPNTNAIMGAVEKDDYSIASSILSTMRSIGHTTSMAVVTLIIGVYLGSGSLNVASSALLTETMRTCFIVFCLICLMGIFISLKRK